MAKRLGEVLHKSLLLGQCVPTFKSNATKIRVKKLELDTNLNMYFKSDYFYYIHDLDKKCKTGDIVLIEELPQKMSKLITHQLVKIIYAFGDVIDPITGKPVAKDRYREDIYRDVELFGKTDSTFEYETSEERGWQDGKRDFTSKKTYNKFHIFDKEDPYAV